MTLFNPAIGVPLALALRIGIVGITLLATRRTEVARYVAFLGAVIASAVTGMTAVSQLETGTPLHGVLLVHRASQFFFTYSVDGLAAWFLLVLTVLTVPAAIFSIGYLAQDPYRERSAFIGAAFNVLVGAVELVFVAGDLFAFLFGWELMTLTTAALVAMEHEKRASRRAAFLYLVMSHVATGCLTAGFLTLAAASGSSAFTALFAGDVVRGPTRDGLFLLFFLGFGVKAGIIPLHVWLPAGHSAARTGISALTSGVLLSSLLTSGIYGIVRVCVFGLGVPRLSWGVSVVALGGLAALLGVLYALVRHDLNRPLAKEVRYPATLLRVAEGMKALQAESLHAYLAYVIVMVVSLVVMVWWGG